MADEDKPRLDYEERELLGDHAKKFSGIRALSWVDDKSVCATCKYSQVIRRRGKNTRDIYCNEIGRWMPGDIEQCSSHQGFTQLSVPQMGGIATLIGGLPERKVGFKNE